jgi:hypothetical protein
MISKLIRKILNQFYIIELVYKADLGSFDAPDTDFVLKKLDLDNLKAMYDEYPSELKNVYDQLKKRISGQTCLVYGIQLGSSFCGYFHVSLGKCYDNVSGYHFNTLGNANLYFFHDYTFEKWRGRGVHKASIIYRMLEGVKMKKETATVAIVKNNIASKKAYINCGFYNIGKLIVFKFFGKHIKLIRDGQDY